MKVSVVQMTSTANVEKNLAVAARLINEAVKQQAQLVVLPENFAFMGFSDAERLRVAEAENTGTIQDFLKFQASNNQVWIVGGTIPLKTIDPQRIRSASLLIDAHGKCVARYDKIHLFDVVVTDAKKNYHESASTEAGEKIIVASTPIGKLGLSVCYDIRFPELYREQIRQGAQCFVIPAAFTKVTGAAHWETLCRSRAIENLSYVCAAGQAGHHENGRETYGHSMIVDPWGKILAQLECGEGVITADIDLQQQQQIREQFPVLTHRR